MSYSQNDPRWKNKRLGGGPNTIGQDGCYLTAGADLDTWSGHGTDPSAMDDIAHFVSGELLMDSWLQDVFPGRWHLEEVYNCAAVPCDQNKLNNDDPNLYVIVGMTGGSLGSGWHFSPIVNWHVPTIADTWPYPSPERSPSVWGLPWSQQIAKVMRYRFLATAPAPAPPPPAPTPAPPAPPPPAPGTFTGVVMAGGAHVRLLPGVDQPIVLQPGPGDPTIVNGGIGLTFDGWCHHQPPVGSDDRWFRTSPGHHWMASVSINYMNNADPPANLLIPDPAAAPPPPAPIPVPVPPAPGPVPFTGDVGALMSVLAWEWETQGDYVKLKTQGFRGVLIRAINGESGTTDEAQFQNWLARAPLARQDGLRAYAWAYWYGPGDAGYTEPDPAAYLTRCVDHIVARQIDTAAYVIDYESRDSTGLAAALKALRDRTGKAVLLSPPGDPAEYGLLGWDWTEIDAAVDGYAPQFYTGAWQSISFQQAFGEWAGRKPIFPASDEQDPTKAAQWVQQAMVDGITGWSVWRIGTVSDAAMQAYAVTTPAPAPQPVPSPAPPPTPAPTPTPDPGPPTPPAGALAWLQQLVNWLVQFFSRSKP